MDNLKDNDTDSLCKQCASTFEFNKFAFENHPKGSYVSDIFSELTSYPFVRKIEEITGISKLVTNVTKLRGAGIHRINNGGFLNLHTDFNSYNHSELGKLDRRVNLLIYLNEEWRDTYNGHFWICDKKQMRVIKKIAPLSNRCVIFLTSKKSIHGHPIPLTVPNNIRRQSVAIYYYTKNTNGLVDFEGDEEHSTLWYPTLKH